MKLSHDRPLLTEAGAARLDAGLAAECMCKGEGASLRRRVISGGTITICLQCDTCGSSLAGPFARVDHPSWAQYADWNGVLPGQWQHQERERWRAATAAREAAWQAGRPDRQREYAEFLRDPRWQRRRERVLWRCRGICESCLDAPATEVHHLSYKQGWLPPAWDLKAVCGACHEEQHSATAAETEPAE